MRLRKIHPLLLALISLLSSCSVSSHNSGYNANPVYAPFHNKKNEVKAIAGYGRVLGIQANVSYSLSNHWAIMAGGVYNHQTIKTDGLFNYLYFKQKSHYLEGAAGYFIPVNWWAITQVEVYGGMGFGSVNKKINSEKVFDVNYSGIKGNFKKAFLVLSALKPITNDFEVGFANRFSCIIFDKLDFYYKSNSIYSSSVSDFRNVSTWVTEPVIIFIYGKQLKLTSQCGLAIPFNSITKKGDTYSNASGVFQFGVLYTLK